MAVSAGIVAAAVVVIGVAAIVVPGASPPPSHRTTTTTSTSTTSTTSTTTTTTLPPGFVAGHVTAVGDSVMLDYQDPLQTDIPGVNVQAATSRQWVDGETVLQQDNDASARLCRRSRHRGG